jgi:hypothetical protein
MADLESSTSENLVYNKYNFQQLKTGIVAFVGNIEKNLQQIIPSLPVFVLNSGDDSYYLNTKFVKTEEKEIYLKTPRFIIAFDDCTPQTDQNTTQYNKVTYTYKDKNYQATCRRVSVEMNVQTDFVCSNFVKALEYYEVILSMFSNDNSYTFEHLGNTMEASYSLQSIQFEKAAMDASSTQKNTTIKTAILLVIQLIIIRPESIQLLDDTVKNLEYRLVTNNDIEKTEDQLNDVNNINPDNELSKTRRNRKS